MTPQLNASSNTVNKAKSHSVVFGLNTASCSHTSLPISMAACSVHNRHEASPALNQVLDPQLVPLNFETLVVLLDLLEPLPSPRTKLVRIFL